MEAPSLDGLLEIGYWSWVIGDWLLVIGPLTPPPTFAGSPPGTGAWVLAHPRNGIGSWNQQPITNNQQPAVFGGVIGHGSLVIGYGGLVMGYG